MRHVLLPGTPATATRRMGQATAPACLIALAGRPLGLVPRFLRAAAGAVNLAAVATAADQHLDPAASTQEQAGRPFHPIGLRRAWTASAASGILPQHVCSAPCGARRRTRAWRFRSAPCLPSDRSSSAPLCARHRPRRCDRRRRRGPACGYVDNARALPTHPQAPATSANINSMLWKGAQPQPAPLTAWQSTTQAVASPHRRPLPQLTGVAMFGIKPDRRSHSLPSGRTPADNELAAYCPDLDQWAGSWRYEERDVSPGHQIVECFKPFLRHLLSLGLSRKTLRKHRDNLWLLGGEIISDLHETPRLRKRPIDQVFARSPQ